MSAMWEGNPVPMSDFMKSGKPLLYSMQDLIKVPPVITATATSQTDTF
jgi:hypothetical protein